MGQDVGDDDRRLRHPVAPGQHVGERAFLRAHGAGHVVALDVGAGNLHRRGVDVDGEDGRSAQLCRSDGENPRARTQVDERAGPAVAIQRGQAELRGGVRAVAKGRAGVDVQHDAVGLRQRQGSRYHQKAAADGLRRENLGRALCR